MPQSPAFLPALPLATSSVLPPHRTRCHRVRPTHRRSAPAPVSVLQERQPEPADAPALDVAPFDLESSALREAIKSIAVGKNGERPIPPAIIPRCADELTLALNPDAPAELLYLRASFLGSLFVKSALTPAENGLLLHAAAPARAAAAATAPTADDAPAGTDDSSDAPQQPVSAAELTAIVAAPADPLTPTANRLLAGVRLTRDEARALGEQLYAPGSMRPLKALIAHVMRVRHESADELSGLAQAVAAASRAARPGVMFGRPVALVAEPYDGLTTWDLLTPLVCRHLGERYGLLAVMGVGETAGPKYGPNLRDVALELGVARWGMPRTEDDTREYGLMADQSDVARGLSEWAWMRRVIVKRPAIATVEKYADVTPDGSRLFIGSAFHPGYVDKMAEVAQAVGFGAYIIVGRGVEGSIGLSILRRDVRLLIGWRVDLVDSSTYQQEDIAFENDVGDDVGPAPKKGSANKTKNANKIERYVAEGHSGDEVFDARARSTLSAIDQAMAVLRQSAPHVFAQCQYPSY